MGLGLGYSHIEKSLKWNSYFLEILFGCSAHSNTRIKLTVP